MIVEVGGMIDDHCARLSLPKEYSTGFFPDGFHPVSNPIQQGLPLILWYKLCSLKLTDSKEVTALKTRKLQIAFS